MPTEGEHYTDCYGPWPQLSDPGKAVDVGRKLRQTYAKEELMAFDAKAAKLPAPGEHYVMPDCPGLRFEASETTRAWIYRYKSPVDGKMRQVKIGDWPAISINRAKAEWEKLRDQRGRGEDPAVARRHKRGQENEEKDVVRARLASVLTAAASDRAATAMK